MRLRVTSSTANLRTAADPRSSILRVLQHGQIVESLPGESGASRWSHVKAGADVGYIARRLLAQSPDQELVAPPAALGAIVDRTLVDLTQTYDAIGYRLGCKAKWRDAMVFSGSDVAGKPCSGQTVDCSGWVAGLFQALAATVNGAAGRPIFAPGAARVMATHSDGQIAGVGAEAGQVYSGLDIDQLPQRSGLLFGVNAGDHDWEGQDRTFEIDHIVIGMQTPEGFYVSQSSSSGGGVNKVAWPTWRRGFASDFERYRVHCVDLLAMGDWSGAAAAAPRSVTDEIDFFNASPG